MRIILTLASLWLLGACQTTPKMAEKAVTGKGRQIITAQRDTRGGSSKGQAVTPDERASSYFQKISQAKTQKEKDRMAILAQTGDFQVHFEFLETLTMAKANDKKPYYSWSTEYIFPIVNEKDFISLQHILVMKMEGSDKAHVVKHWRQDWKYQDREDFIYKGYKTWKKKRLSRSEVKGTWSQAVYQVDDSPRYKTRGKWVHSANMSQWTSVETNRPLPRREYTVRSDYQVLRGINTVTVTAHSWYHEQSNLKTVVDAKTLKPGLILSKEIGLNRYERIKDFDFSEGQKYWEATKDYWTAVRKEWDRVIATQKTVKMSSEKYGKRLYENHFSFAQKIVDKDKTVSPKDYKKHAQSTIKEFLK